VCGIVANNRRESGRLSHLTAGRTAGRSVLGRSKGRGWGGIHGARRHPEGLRTTAVIQALSAAMRAARALVDGPHGTSSTTRYGGDRDGIHTSSDAYYLRRQQWGTNNTTNLSIFSPVRLWISTARPSRAHTFCPGPARCTTPPPRMDAPSSNWCLGDRTETVSHITGPWTLPGHSRRCQRQKHVPSAALTDIVGVALLST
jgi:hypothetical protein